MSFSLIGGFQAPTFADGGGEVHDRRSTAAGPIRARPMPRAVSSMARGIFSSVWTDANLI